MNSRTFFRLICLSVFAGWLLWPALATAQVPETIAYQGYLTDADGNPLGGTVNLAFRLYDAPTGGAAAWAESQLDVPVSGGVFAVDLGHEESLGSVAFDKPLWLAVSVNGGDELSPRVALNAAPYALSTRGLRVVPGDDEDDPPSIIAGGASNMIADEDDRSATISGGSENVVGDHATVGGGRSNAALSCSDTVGGGENNRAEGYAFGNKTSGARCGATVAGGNGNTANNEVATVGGGYRNEASGGYSTVGGGANNSASGRYSTVPGGSNNTATGTYSFAAGHEAEAGHDGTFVWSDAGTEGSQGFSSTAENQFLIRAAGGVGIGTNAPQGALHVMHADDIELDLILGGSGDDAIFGDIGMIGSDPALPSSDLLLVSNDAVGVVLNADDSDETSEFIITDQDILDPIFQVDLSGAVTTGHVALENELGAGTTLEAGGVYRDNVVYAWAHVNADGSVASSFGCTVLRTGLGRYRVTYDQSLPGGVAPVVSPLSANDPVIATVAPSGASITNVVVFSFVNGQFQSDDRPFFIQVVGRP